jgi:hypothetical protein
MNPEVTPRIALISAREVVASKYLRSSALSAVPSQNALREKIFLKRRRFWLIAVRMGTDKEKTKGVFLSSGSSYP